MAKQRGDLPSFLYYGDRNVHGVLADYLQSLPDINTPWTLRVTVRGPRESTESEVFKQGIANSSPEGLISLLGAVETAISNNQGPAPDITVRVRAWTKGHGQKSPVNISQRIYPPSESSAQGGAELLRWIIDRQFRHENHAHNTILQTNAQLSGLLADAHDQIGRISTQRAIASTAADGASGMAGLWQVLALMALIVGWPALKRALRVSDSATAQDVLAMAQMKLLDVQSKFGTAADGDAQAPPAPPGSYEPPPEDPFKDGPEDDGDGPGGDDGGPEGSDTGPPLIAAPIDIPGFLEQLKSDPALLLGMGKAIESDPVLSALIKATQPPA